MNELEQLAEKLAKQLLSVNFSPDQKDADEIAIHPDDVDIPVYKERILAALQRVATNTAIRTWEEAADDCKEGADLAPPRDASELAKIFEARSKAAALKNASPTKEK